MFYHPLRMTRPEANGPKTWYDIKGATEEVAEIRIYDSIGYWGVTAADFAAELATVTAPRILLRVNSAGGDVFDGLAIFNLLRDHPATVETRVDGLAGSIASIIALAGNTVAIAETAFMMIHNPWAFAIGNAADMRAMADTLDKISEPLVKVYTNKTGKPAEEIRGLLDAETWYTGAEAVEAGLADVLLELSDATEADSDQAAAAINPAIYVNPPAELAGDTQPAADALELQKRRLALMGLE